MKPETSAEIMAKVELAEAMRAMSMPDEHKALQLMFAAYLRLKELGFKEAIYCPKDGTVFEAIEPGSTGIFKCHYEGEWPKGRWWAHEANDLWPSRPCLFRPIQEKDNGKSTQED